MINIWEYGSAIIKDCIHVLKYYALCTVPLGHIIYHLKNLNQKLRGSGRGNCKNILCEQKSIFN